MSITSIVISLWAESRHHVISINFVKMGFMAPNLIYLDKCST